MTSRPATGLPDDPGPIEGADGSQPLVGDDPAQRHQLSPRVVAYWRWRWSISLISLLILLVALALVIPWGDGWIRWTIVAVVAGVGIGGLVVLPPIRYRVFWYAISPTEIDIQHGIVFIKRSVIPMHRVQSLRVERGPIANHFRMSTLRIQTAASTLTCSGLDRREADVVCSRISELADVADDL